MHISRRILGIVAAIALLPLLGLLTTALMAGVLGCEVSENGATPCIVMGADIGGLLSGMLTAGWFGLVTIPLLMLLVALWSIVEAYVWGRQRRKDRRAAR
jgi:hypothetical protein